MITHSCAAETGVLQHACDSLADNLHICVTCIGHDGTLFCRLRRGILQQMCHSLFDNLLILLALRMVNGNTMSMQAGRRRAAEAAAESEAAARAEATRLVLEKQLQQEADLQQVCNFSCGVASDFTSNAASLACGLFHMLPDCIECLMLLGMRLSV